MKQCSCGNIIPATIQIDGKRRNLKNRTKCLVCLPFGQSKFKKSDEDRLLGRRNNSKKHYTSYKLENGVDPVRAIRERRKQSLVVLFGGGCQICGYSKCVRNLAFHHLHNKTFGLSSRAFQFGVDKIIDEAKKCILVCHNCHGEIHDGLVENDLITSLNDDIQAPLAQWS